MPPSDVQGAVMPCTVRRRVVSLHVYPLKGGRALDLDRLVITPQGAEGDRIWMVVDAEGAFVSQRSAPRMARIVATPDEEGGLHLAWDTLDEPHEPAPGLFVPAAEGDARPLDVFGRSVTGVDAGDEAADWLFAVLGFRTRLVSARRAPGQYVDAAPLLVTTTASLADLRMDALMPMDRFRPNIVVETSVPWEEDAWTHLDVSGAAGPGGTPGVAEPGGTRSVRLRVVKPCLRCSVPAHDQRTGARTREPVAALARQRRVDKGVAFGVYVTLDAPIRPAGELEARITVIKE